MPPESPCGTFSSRRLAPFGFVFGNWSPIETGATAAFQPSTTFETPSLFVPGELSPPVSSGRREFATLRRLAVLSSLARYRGLRMLLPRKPRF